jgi:hypothetical protein
MEAGLNTSTIALRDIGGDEKGTLCLSVLLGHPVPEGHKIWGPDPLGFRRLESEIVKFGHEPSWTRTQECLCWQEPAAIVNDRPIFS